MGRYTTGGVGRDVLAGAIAGGAAVWLISKLDWSLSHAGRTEPGQNAATKAADAAGVRINENQKRIAGHTVHYGIGIGVGALYGLLRGMAPSVTTGRGALFGVASFILGDEIGAPAMGLAKGPLNYSAGDHARGALSHIVFGVFTDLGTRLISPWKNEVVIMRGPTIGERVEGGRQAIADGRDYLYDQGRWALDQGRSYAEQAREQIDELDLPRLARKGKKRARKYLDELRSRLPDRDELIDAVASRAPDRDHIYDAAERARKRARGLALRASSYVPDRDEVEDAVEQVRSRGRGWFRNLADRLPDRDDVDDAVETGSKHARKLAKRARERLPDRDDLDDVVSDGRKRVRRLADDARDRGESTVTKVSRWLFG